MMSTGGGNVSKAIVIIGCHRSATSLIAKALHDQSNVDWVAESMVNESNKHGHWENAELIGLNDRILAAARGKWYKPPTVKAIDKIAHKFTGEIEGVMRTLSNDGKAGIWGMKDPRMVLTWQIFRPIVEILCDDIHVLFQVRSMDRIAASLNERSPQLKINWLAIARIYRERMLYLLAQEP